VKARVCLLALLVAPTFAAQARAEQGYFSGNKGARAAGRAGAFTAKADDLSAVTFNPAGLSDLDGTLLHAGNRFSYNAYAFTRAPTLDWGNVAGGVPPYVRFATVENQKPWQLLEPLAGVASNLGLQDWAFALAAYAPAGVARQQFPAQGGQRYMMVEREAIILHYNASVAWQHKSVFGVGASLQWIHVPRLTYSLVIDGVQFPGEVNPVSSELDMLATVSGSDPFTLNAIVGAWYRPVPFLELGVSGQVIPAEIKTQSTLSVEPLSPEIEERVELRREGQPADDVSLLLPLAQSARVGVRYRHLENEREVFDVELDLAYEFWSGVERFVVDGDGLQANLLAQRLDVGLIEVEKHWRDTLSVHLGGDYALVPERLTLRGGVFYETAVADRRYANIDFVSGRELGGAVGASVFAFGVEVALAYEYRYQPALTVSEGEARVFQEAPGSQCQAPFTDPDNCHEQYPGRPSPAVNAGTYTAYSHVASLDVLYRF
jgi:long-chain fatty acid transport protein